MNDHPKNDNTQSEENDRPKRSISEVILILLLLQALIFLFVGWQSQALLNIAKACF